MIRRRGADHGALRNLVRYRRIITVPDSDRSPFVILLCCAFTYGPGERMVAAGRPGSVS